MVRGWWALLVLGAVIAMHGLQCASAPVVHAASAAPGVALAVPAMPGHPLALPLELEPVHAAPSDTPMPHSAPHDDGDHLLALCLAILAAGVAGLLGLLRRRLLRGAITARAPGRTPPRIATVRLRPPDVFTLCVLRQ